MLLGLLIVGTVLEMIGLGLIIPATVLLVRTDPFNYPALQPLQSLLGHPSHTQLVAWGMIFLLAVFLIKSLFLVLVAWRQNRFVYGVQISLSQRLFASYMRQPYTFHLQHNSSALLNNVTNEVGVFGLTLSSILGLIAEALALVGIAILLVSVEPIGALIVGAVLGLSSLAFYRATHARITRWGKARQRHDGLRIQHLQQGLGSAKDVKLLGREDEFLSQFASHNVKIAHAGEMQSTLLALPRLWLELLAVAGLATLVLTTLAQNRPLLSIIPTLGLFAAAAFRLMPSVNRVLSTLQTIRFGFPAISLLHAESRLRVSEEIPGDTTPRPFDREVQLDNVRFTYPEAVSPALDGVTLSIAKGESVGFVGPSGSGKSTLVDVILGLLKPDMGKILVDGSPVADDARSWQRHIGYVPQFIYLTDDTLRRNVALGLPDSSIDDAAVQAAINAAQLEDLVADLPEGMNTVIGERGVRLSGGQRQRIGIARALYHRPDVLVLDEATSALDLATEAEVMRAVTALKRDKTLIIVAHRLSTVEQCDRLYRLERGRLVGEGNPAELLGKSIAFASA